MANDALISSEQALTQLFFHCCFKDGKVTDGELDDVSAKLVAAGLNRELNFKDEVRYYKTHEAEHEDEAAFIAQLISCIRPTNDLALFSSCVELCLSDGFLQPAEETFLKKLGAALNLTEEEQSICTRLMVQRRVVATEKLY